MNSFSSKQANTLLGYLASEKDFRFKQSQSGEYIEPNLAAEIQFLYQDLLRKTQKAKLKFNQLQEFQYRTQTQSGKVSYIRMVLDYFFNTFCKVNKEENNEIECDDCKNYETYLQKLENQIRQHIRLEQQLKLYQENLEQKIEEQKKQCEKNTQKIFKLQNANEELKAKEHGFQNKISKLEDQNQKIKQDTIKNKSGLIGQNSHRAIRDISHSSQTKSFKALHEMKQNIIIQKGSHKKEQKKQPRKSIQKRPQSNQKWRNSNTNSIKQLPINEKIVMQKNKEQKRKAIQAKFELRR